MVYILWIHRVSLSNGFKHPFNTIFPGYHFENNKGIIFSDTTIIISDKSKDYFAVS